MIKKLLPLIAAVAVVAALSGPARQYLPGGLQLRSEGTLATSDEPLVDRGRPTGIGLAPAPVVNQPATGARLVVTAQPLPKAEQGYALAVTVVSPDGKPLADASVKFFELVDLFGQREMLLGAGTTDGRGNASYGYLPAQKGIHQIVARSARQDRVTVGEGRMTFEATVARDRTLAERSPLSLFSDRVPFAAGLVVLAVWCLIGFALLSTARGVIGGARGTPRKGKPA